MLSTMTSTKEQSASDKSDKQFAIPVYATVRRTEEITGHDFELLGVSLDEQVAIQRLTTFMVEQLQTVWFTAMDETELAAWIKTHWGEIAEGSWHVSANRRLWVTCCDRIEIEEHDALEPLAGEL